MHVYVWVKKISFLSVLGNSSFHHLYVGTFFILSIFALTTMQSADVSGCLGSMLCGQTWRNRFRFKHFIPKVFLQSTFSHFLIHHWEGEKWLHLISEEQLVKKYKRSMFKVLEIYFIFSTCIWVCIYENRCPKKQDTSYNPGPEL